MLRSLIAPRKALQENMMMELSRMLIMIRDGDLFSTCLRVLRTTESGHFAQCQDFRSGQHEPHPERQVSSMTVQSWSMGMTFLIGIFQWKDPGDITMLVGRPISARSGFVMLIFSFEFYTFCRLSINRTS